MKQKIMPLAFVFVILSSFMVGCASSSVGSPPQPTSAQSASSDSITSSEAESKTDNRLEQMQAAILQYPSQNSEWKYEVYDCYIAITGYIGQATELLVIPEQIEELPVWRLNLSKSSMSWCWNHREEVTSVTLPDSLLVIERGTFDSFANLTTIDLPEGLQRIESDAFACCSALKEVVLPSTLTEMGSGAFTHSEIVSLTVLNPDMKFPDGLGSVQKIYGHVGSTAAQYAAKLSIEFHPIA